jgi:lactoylglutathione lyase
MSNTSTISVLCIIFSLFISVISLGALHSGPDIRVKIDHIAVAVTDLSESESFYRDVIGLKQIPEPFGVGRHAWFDIGGAELHVIQAADERRERNRSNHLCFSVDDLDAFMEHLTANGVEYSDFAGNVGEVNIRPDGVRQIYFTDPDGYWIEVNDAGRSHK